MTNGEVSVKNKKPLNNENSDEQEAYINELIVFSMAFLIACMYFGYMGMPANAIEVVLQSFFFAFIGVNLKNLLYNII